MKFSGTRIRQYYYFIFFTLDSEKKGKNENHNIQLTAKKKKYLTINNIHLMVILLNKNSLSSP